MARNPLLIVFIGAALIAAALLLFVVLSGSDVGEERPPGGVPSSASIRP